MSPKMSLALLLGTLALLTFPNVADGVRKGVKVPADSKVDSDGPPAEWLETRTLPASLMQSSSDAELEESEGSAEAFAALMEVQAKAQAEAEERAEILNSLNSTAVTWPSGWEDKLVGAKAVGQGSFGTVYVAKLKCDGTPVAIKVLAVKQDAADDEVALLQAFSDSSRFTTFYMQGRTNGRPTLHYVMMEAALGGDFYNLIGRKDNGVEWQEKVRVWGEMVAGVDQMHKRGIVHRDLKPANVMLSLKCTGRHPCKAKVGDLGLACSLEGNMRGVPSCRGHGGSGTLLYLPPEIYSKGPKGLHYKNDEWACGLILYELLFGNLPEAMTGLRTEAQFRKAITTLRIENDRRWARVPPQLQPIMKGLLTLRVQDRASCGSATRALTAAFGFDFSSDAPVPMPCWEKKARKPRAPPPPEEEADDFLQEDGAVEFMTIRQAATNIMASYLSAPKVINEKGFVYADDKTISMLVKGKYLPRALTKGSRLLEVNNIPYEDYWLTMNKASYTQDKEQFLSDVRMIYKGNLQIKYSP